MFTLIFKQTEKNNVARNQIELALVLIYQSPLFIYVDYVWNRREKKNRSMQTKFVESKK